MFLFNLLDLLLLCVVLMGIGAIISYIYFKRVYNSELETQIEIQTQELTQEITDYANKKIKESQAEAKSWKDTTTKCLEKMKLEVSTRDKIIRKLEQEIRMLRGDNENQVK